MSLGALRTVRIAAGVVYAVSIALGLTALAVPAFRGVVAVVFAGVGVAAAVLGFRVIRWLPGVTLGRPAVGWLLAAVAAAAFAILGAFFAPYWLGYGLAAFLVAAAVGSVRSTAPSSPRAPEPPAR